MAFPTVLQNTSGFVSSTAGLTANALITLPSTIDSGDMLLAIFSANGGTGTTITWNSSAVGSWTQISSNVYTTNYITEVWQRIADGTEDGKQLRIDLDSNRPSAWIVYRLSGHSTLSPNVAVANSQSSSAAVNPPNLAPSWAPPATDTLWFAVMTHARLSGSITGVPTNYTDNVAVNATGGSTARVSLFSTQRNLNASSEDPDTYTASSTGTSMGLTIGVRGIGIQVSNANTNIYANESGVRLQGTNLSGVTNVLLTSGSRNVQTTVTSADSGNVYFTVPPISSLVSSNIKFQSVTLTANDASSSGSIGSNLLPNTGFSIHDVTDLSQISNENCIYYGQVPQVQVGDQILYTSTGVTIDSQGFYTFDSGTTSFDYYIFDTTDEAWGGMGTITTTAASSPYISNKIRMYIRVV